MEIAFDQVVGFTAIFLAGAHVTSLFVPLTLDSVIYGSLGETTGYFLSASLVLRIYFYYYFFFLHFPKVFLLAFGLFCVRQTASTVWLISVNHKISFGP